MWSLRSLLARAAVADAGDRSYQHHELVEVDLTVSIKVQLFEQLVQVFLILCSLYKSKDYVTSATFSKLPKSVVVSIIFIQIEPFSRSRCSSSMTNNPEMYLIVFTFQKN